MPLRVALPLLVAACGPAPGWEAVQQELSAIRVDVAAVHHEVAALRDDVDGFERQRAERATMGNSREAFFADEQDLSPVEVEPGLRYRLDAATRAALLNRERLEQRGYARAVTREGAQVGYRLTDVHSNSLTFRLGLRSGDLVLALDDVPLTSPAATIAALQAAAEAPQVRLTVQRHGSSFPLVWERDLAPPEPGMAP